MSFATVAMVDWSGGGDTGPRPRKDAIWACTCRAGMPEAPVYLRHRAAAVAHLSALIEAALSRGERLLLGFDFPFGYPAGFARAVCGSDDPLALWDWFAQALPEGDAAARFELAGRINAMFPGVGPFWFNGLRRDVDGLPRKGTDRTMAEVGVSERREAEARAPRAFPLWQMGGAGAVGSQAMTGMAALARLRAAFPGKIAVWPFEPLDRPVALVEIWPSLIDGVVKAAMAQAHEPPPIKDAVQVSVLARAVGRAAASGDLASWLADVPEGAARREEGWILGLGHEAALARAAAPALPDLVPPRLRNDCFAMPQGVNWVPVDDALALLRARLSPVVGTERIAASAALGRVLAQDAVAARSNPPGANAAVDGYGFAHAATGEGRQVLSLVPGRAAAGAPFAGTVQAGSAVRILTGALLPHGVDTVVLEEDCATDATHVAFDGPVKPGANTRKAGEDVVAGAVALKAGRVLAAQDIALLTALGLPDIDVRRRLRVGVLSTGDEIAAPGPVPAGPDVTYDANRPMLLALAARWGFAPVDLGHVGDDRGALRARLTSATALADVILTSGGASAGDEDHVSALLNETGSLHTWRVAVKPGRPLALGVWQGVPVFGLPGNPVAAFTCTLIFARPALSVMAGAGWQAPRGYRVPAAFAKDKKPGRREYLRARLDDAGRAEVFRSEGSGRISGLSWAEGLVELPDDGLRIRPGDPVTYHPFGSFGL